MKIRIFTLAKELNMDSKLLIEYCQKLGIVLKNSALASISAEERDRVLELIKQGSATPEPVQKAAPPVPTRETPRVVSTKVPPIRTMAPRPHVPSTGLTAAAGGQAAVAAVAGAEATAVAHAAGAGDATDEPRETPAPAAREESESPLSRRKKGPPSPQEGEEPESPTTEPTDSTVDAPAVGTTSTLDHESTSQTVATTHETVVPAVEDAKTITPTASDETEAQPVEEPPRPVVGMASRGTEPSTPRPGSAPMRREDYLPASGTGLRASAAPRDSGSTDTASKGPKKPKTRPGPALPQIAPLPPAPKKPTAMVATATEGPAQKPDVRFKDAAAAKKPLQEHIKRNADEKKKTRLPDGTDEEELRRAGKGVRGGVPVPGVPASGLGLLSERKSRQAKRTRGGVEEEDEGGAHGRRASIRHKNRRTTPVSLKTSATIEMPITVRTLSEAIGRPAAQLIGNLMRKGKMVTINSSLDDETALELAMEMGVDLDVKREEDVEDRLESQFTSVDESAERTIRPPIVTILGHVDHGKTTLLDTIRSANVAAGEVGGITQHIAAYQIDHGGRKITFLDTPGHAAFSEMRARGANVTDVAVLVVAANDGVMPQTVEAINHARAANVPIVVAMNKVDLPDKNEQRVMQDLATHNVLVADWGGDVEVVRTSGLTGAGIDDLLETLLTIAELRTLTADADSAGRGVCLEAFREEGRGVLAWLIVQDGTLLKGDVILCGSSYGRVRNIYNDQDEEIESAGPSTPVRIAGLDEMPGAGDKFLVMADIEEARSAAIIRRDRAREKMLSSRGKLRTLSDILTSGPAGTVQDLPVIVKADTPGSVEALKGEVLKFQHPEVQVKLLHEGVGGVNESDVYLASASGAIIVAFHVVPEERARALAEREGVEIREYGIIYEVTKDIKLALEGLLRPDMVEVPTGRAIVLQTFKISRFGTIAGCRVLHGIIERSNRIRVIRDQRTLAEYNIGSLKRNKDDVKEVREGLECGIRLENFEDIKEGDLLQAFRIEEVKRSL